MLKRTLCMLGAILVLGGCSNDHHDTGIEAPPPWVMTVSPEPRADSVLRLSGTVRARHEVPLSFQVGGRILQRNVDAGERIESEQVLFTLDSRDLDETVRVASAQLRAAQAALDTADSELRRQQQLVERNFVSHQTLEQYQLAARDARSRADAAEASLAQSRNARAYAELTSDHAGVLIQVNGEPGQVVAMGQTVALLARDGEREIEVFLPDGNRVPPAGRVVMTDGSGAALTLREVAGAADSASLSWRARYRVDGDEHGDLPLGAVVQVSLEDAGAASGLFAVPPAALDERGDGPRVWIVIDGRAEPLPVEVVRLAPQRALVRADLEPGTRVISLGTHLLMPGRAVRERAR